MTISIVTTCKGRLLHLKECLPTWIAAKPHEIIVVDYDCPEQSGAYAESMGVFAVYPKPHNEYFNLSHARNAGLIGASGDAILFIDADTKITDGFLKYHARVLEPGQFLTGWGFGDATGSCLVWREDALKVRGYNEIVDGWGFDDIDFYKRLEASGISQKPFHHGIETIKHGDEERVKHYRVKRLRSSDRVNSAMVQRQFKSIIP